MSLVVKHSQGAEALVKLNEGKLCEEDAVNGDIRSIDAVMSTLKVGSTNKYIIVLYLFIVAFVYHQKSLFSAMEIRNR